MPEWTPLNIVVWLLAAFSLGQIGCLVVFLLLLAVDRIGEIGR